MRLFKVTVETPVMQGAYYVGAEGFDAAEALVLKREQWGELRPGGIKSIEVVAYKSSARTSIERFGSFRPLRETMGNNAILTASRESL